MLEALYARTETMISLVGQLLDIARIETGPFPTETSPFNPTPLINAFIQEHMPLIEEKNLIFHSQIAPDLPVVRIYKEHLETILTVLLENAIRYTPSQGEITLIASSPKKNELLFMLKDTGVGFPKKQQDRIFTRFFRADNAVAAHPNGTGLGLFYAKLLVEKQGGKIWFRSEENKGTTFSVSLPV